MTGPGLNVARNDPRMPALRRIRPPGLLLLCAALLDFLFYPAWKISLLLGAPLMPPPQVEPWQIAATVAGTVLTRSLAVAGAWSAFSLRHWHLAVVGALSIMMPLAPASCMGFLLGPWLLFILLDPDVRKHFT